MNKVKTNHLGTHFIELTQFSAKTNQFILWRVIMTVRKGKWFMENKSFMQRVGGIVVGVLYITFGLVIISNPMATLRSLSFILGWTITVSGLSLFFSSFFIKGYHDFKTATMIEGLLIGLLGMVFLFGDFIDSTDILAYLLVFWIIINSAMQLQFAHLIPHMGIRIFTIALDIFVISYSIMMLFTPSKPQNFLVFVIGIGVIANGASKVIRSFYTRYSL